MGRGSLTSLWCLQAAEDRLERNPGGKGTRLEFSQGDCIGNGKYSLYQENGNMKNIFETQTMECSQLDGQ